MNRRFVLAAVLVCLLAGSAASAWHQSYDLDRAHRMRDRGDFWEARRLYRAISDDWNSDRWVRREASYFVGFCSVRLSESWAAIDEFRRFLREYDDGDTRFVPDSLYVLGRTYEEVGYTDRARESYRECIRRFRYGEFPEKSRDRLRNLGDYYGPHYSMEAVPGALDVQRADVKAGESGKTGNDPFDGFVMKSVQTEKIAGFLDSAKKGNLQDGLSTLTPEEKSLGVVRDEIRKDSDRQRFEQLHQNP